MYLQVCIVEALKECHGVGEPGLEVGRDRRIRREGGELDLRARGRESPEPDHWNAAD